MFDLSDSSLLGYNFKIYYDNEFDNDIIFRKACELKYKKIIKYLRNDCPRYDYVEQDGYYQPIIKDKIIE